MPRRPRALFPGRAAAFVGVLALGLGLVLTACSDDGGDTATDPATSSTSESDESSSEPASGASTCSYSTEGAAPAAKQVDPPPEQAAAAGQVPVTITTSVGTIAADLDADSAPCTVNSFLSLAGQGYFEDTVCHRLVTSGIYVLQCGDPTGTGTGGPGYSFDDELTGQETYGPGTLAMANAGPDTNGSQFFMVYGNSPLPPSYTVFGQIDTAGIAVIKKVAKAGTDNAYGQDDGHPNTEVRLESVTAAD